MTTPYIPGQDYIGAHVDNAPQIFAADAYFQKTPHAGGLTPTVTLFGTNSGTGASTTTVTGFDGAGHFSITAGTAPAAGTVAVLTFGRPLQATPSAVTVSMGDTSASTTALAAGAVNVTKTGFSVTSGAMTLNHVYLVSYSVWQ